MAIWNYTSSDSFIVALSDIFFGERSSTTFQRELEKLIGRNVADFLLSLALGSSLSKEILNTSEELLRLVLKDKVSSFLTKEGVFKFPQHPKKISISETALKTEVDLGSNTFIRYGWGSKLISTTITGWFNLSPYSLFNTLIGKLSRFDIAKVFPTNPVKLSDGWFQLWAFKKYFQSYNHKPHIVVIAGKIWYGWLDNFSFDLDANYPNYCEYRLVCSFHPLSGWDLFYTQSAVDGIKNLIDSGEIRTYSYDSTNNWLPESKRETTMELI